MRYNFKGLNRPKSIAKKLSVFTDMPLSQAREQMAQISGYRNWKELVQENTDNKNDTWLIDPEIIQKTWIDISWQIMTATSCKMWIADIIEFVAKSGWVCKSASLSTMPINEVMRCYILDENTIIIHDMFSKLLEACLFVVHPEKSSVQRTHFNSYRNHNRDYYGDLFYHYMNSLSSDNVLLPKSDHETGKTLQCICSDVISGRSEYTDTLWIGRHPESKTLEVSSDYICDANYVIISGLTGKKLPHLSHNVRSLTLIDCPDIVDLVIPEHITILNIEYCNNLEKLTLPSVINYLSVDKCRNFRTVGDTLISSKINIHQCPSFRLPENVLSSSIGTDENPTTRWSEYSLFRKEDGKTYLFHEGLNTNKREHKQIGILDSENLHDISSEKIRQTLEELSISSRPT